MTDKVQKIKEWISKTQDGLMDANGNFGYPEHEGAYHILCNLDAYIDSLQEEPVSEDLEKACEQLAENARKHKAETSSPFFSQTDYKQGVIDGAKWKEKRLLPMIDNICGICQKQQDFINAKDLGEQISTLGRRYPEVSFAKLSRIAVRVAKWQKQHLWKPADCDDLPEIDKEVIALTQPYPNDEHLRVVFAHRPTKYTKVWNSDLGEEQIVEVERYGKGEWNIPNIKYWLDVELPKEIEL